MKEEQKKERTLPGLQVPVHIQAEIEKAKGEFFEKYAIDPQLHMAAHDPTLPYPINWWDLMDNECYREWQALEADYYDLCTSLQLGWEREDYMLSQDFQQQLQEQQQLDKCLQKVRAYSGRETLLEEHLCIPLLAGIEEVEIKAEIIILSVKFGYPCPFSLQELSEVPASSDEVSPQHPAFIKYKEEISPQVSIDKFTLLNWEYEQASRHLETFVPAGYYIGIEPDFGWGVFIQGAFDGEDY